MSRDPAQTKADTDKVEAEKAAAIGAALAALYRAADRGMRELPIYNTALEVAAVGFRAHEGRALGVVLTPWFMNLVLAPLDAGEGSDAPPGATVSRSLPAGLFEFTVGALDGFGIIESCSLYSPMFDFADQQSALAAAEAALQAVLDPGFDVAPAETAAASPPKPRSAAIDRRNFLRGALSSGARP
ncbi:[NiFe] hydrogenase assembly HybE family chaperone [Rhodopseudomonas rhenobacensis]|uniref:[NiFe] hydrogenase assembly HybE family chaperone n=1 Tax=Rhodopseudomonas rhenobacensis TaxID=87461 RepID=A0A7W7Z3W0_9BRAD|nr:[NiFe]-hydrogenase assembly chaperone HybE [Rhodopseudomonas rhenobacensis]MBB5047310.1 [NiFe] hydrogenase assembly HybE family chaperone [Rhodopseudomonas rhenobacensis]